MKRKYLFPTIVIAGVAAYMLLTKNKSQAAIAPVVDPGTDYTDPALYPDSGYIEQPVPVKTYVPTTPVNQIITTTDAVKKQYLQSLATRIPATSPLWPALNLMSQQSLMNLWSISSYINGDQSNYWTAFVKMTDPEIASVWYYVGTYLGNNKPLLNATKKNSDGSWDNTNPGNPDLYNKIVAIHNKYGIF